MLSVKHRKIVIAVLVFAVILGAALFFDFTQEEEMPQGDRPAAWSSDLVSENLDLLPDFDTAQLAQPVREARQRMIDAVIEDRGGDLLLVKEDSFFIEYIAAAEVFWVSITDDPAEEARAGAELWFRDFGVMQSDLCDLPVRFLLYGFALQAAHPDFSSLPTGCPMPE